jgi:hypothetical protein
MKTLVGVFNDRDDAENAVQELRDMNIADTDISVAGTNAHGDMTMHDAGDDAAEVAGGTAAGAASGATTGGVIGAIAGLAVANGILPGLGTLFVAGPLATALGFTGAAATTAAGALTGAAAGGLVGALGGLGISASDASNYENRVKSGGTLVTARVDNYDEDEVREVFDKFDAEDVNVYTA